MSAMAASSSRSCWERISVTIDWELARSSSIPEIARAAAEYLGVKPEGLAEFTSANAEELFFQ